VTQRKWEVEGQFWRRDLQLW